MFPRSAAPRGRSDNFNGLYPPPPHMPRCYDYNHQRLPGVNKFYVPELVRFPTYEWKPRPRSPVPPPAPPTHTPAMVNVRKRQYDDYSPHAVKRQRLGSPLTRAPAPAPAPPRHPPPRPTLPPRSGHAVAGSSRSSTAGFDYTHPSSHARLQPKVPESSNILQTYAKDKLSNQMLELFEACQQQTPDLLRKELCRTRLQNDIQTVYAVARLYLTGSSINGLGCRSSDADLCLVIKGNKKVDPIQVLSVLRSLFRTLPYIERTQLIRAKVPILRFKERGSDLEFDLNINNTVGIRNTFLLRSYAYADLRIRPMILVIKKWARHNQINDASKGTLSSYTLVLMALHYLQTLKEPVLPSLQRDYPECFYHLMDIDMVPEGPKNIPPYSSRNQSCLGELLLGFLKYYATDFRWDKLVISVREAKAFPKNNSLAWRNKYICVEEPFERNNVARAVHEKFKFDAIKAEFARASQILQDRKDLNSILPVRAIINKEASSR